MSYESMRSEEPDEVEVLLRPDGMTTEIWLRKDIEQDTADIGEESYTYWKYVENHLVVPGNVSAESVDFDALWEQAEEEAKTDAERIADLQVQNAELQAAVLELGDILGGE